MADERQKSPTVPIPSPRNHYFTLDSPIGVIGAVLAIIELVLILGIIFADGNIRWGLLFFGAVLALLVIGGFFYVLITQPGALYRPADYAGETTVEAFSGAFKRNPSPVVTGEALIESVEIAVRRAMTSGEIIESVTNALPAETEDSQREQTRTVVEEALNLAATRAVEEIGESSLVTVDLGFTETDENGSPSVLRLVAGETWPAEDLLFLIASHMAEEEFRRAYPDREPSSAVEAPEVRARTDHLLRSYGLNWTLYDPKQEKTFDQLRDYADMEGKNLFRLVRSASEVGITAGSHLEVMRDPSFWSRGRPLDSRR